MGLLYQIATVRYCFTKEIISLYKFLLCANMSTSIRKKTEMRETRGKHFNHLQNNGLTVSLSVKSVKPGAYNHTENILQGIVRKEISVLLKLESLELHIPTALNACESKLHESFKPNTYRADQTYELYVGPDHWNWPYAYSISFYDGKVKQMFHSSRSSTLRCYANHQAFQNFLKESQKNETDFNAGCHNFNKVRRPLLTVLKCFIAKMLIVLRVLYDRDWQCAERDRKHNKVQARMK